MDIWPVKISHFTLILCFFSIWLAPAHADYYTDRLLVVLSQTHDNRIKC